MKSSIACFIAAVSRFLQNKRDFNGSISFLITGDEEGYAINGTKKVVEYLKKRREKINFCIVGEPTNPNKLGEMIKIGRRGSLTGKIEVFGVQGHVAYPQLLNNPINTLVNICKQLKLKLPRIIVHIKVIELKFFLVGSSKPIKEKIQNSILVIFVQ